MTRPEQTQDGVRPVSLDDVMMARERIAPYIRRTPLVPAKALKDQQFNALSLSFKLELLQVTGSFKPRGAVNKLLSLSDDVLQRGIVTASGGNHGLAVAYAGWLAKKPAIVYLPRPTPDEKAQKLRQWGAQVVFEGEFWDESNAAALARAERDGLAYIHPFADPAVIAGQGTIALEILDDQPDVDTLLVAIGGGGLISGISAAAKALRPSMRVIGIEPTGAPTLKASVEAGHVVELPAITTTVGTLAARKSTPINLASVEQFVSDIVLVSDEEMAEAARWLWFELSVAAERSGAAAMAALLKGRVATQPGERVCVLVCGAGLDW